ncbi:MAG: hypothetical protein AB1403_23685 [Candidatus Riflebacteria bacterium]
MVFSHTMEWLTTTFSSEHVAIGFALLIPLAFIIRFISSGALVFNADEIGALNWGISIFSFLFFGVGFFWLQDQILPESIRTAYDAGGITGFFIGAFFGLLMMSLFGHLIKKLGVESKLKATLEGYPVSGSRKK